ncbi:hypothetical protein PFISCL1PPCAC_13104, partial [Pristionchus fissidentatus]
LIVNMVLRLIVLAALVSDAASYVYTCNEMKNKLIPERVFINATEACIVPPEGVEYPIFPSPYSSYVTHTYLVDIGSDLDYPLNTFMETDGRYCKSGVGPWTLQLRHIGVDQIVCDSEGKHSELVLIFTSDNSIEKNIVRASSMPKTKTFGKGTYTFVALEGGLIIGKLSVVPYKETTLQFFTGAGDSIE